MPRLLGRGTTVSLAAGDYDGDGRLDLIAGSPYSGTVSLFLSEGRGHFGPPTTLPLTTDPLDVFAFDATSDGKTDIVTIGGMGIPTVLPGNGDGTFATPISSITGISGYPHAVAGEVNGDGITDLIAVDTTVVVLLGNGDGTYTRGFSSPLPARQSAAAIGDFDEDGVADVVVSFWEGAPGPAVYFGNGDGSFAGPVNVDTIGYVEDLTVGDLDGDGHLDIAAAQDGSYPGSVLVWPGLGNGVFAPAVIYPADDHNYKLAAGDFDGDGRTDLVDSGDHGLNLYLQQLDGTLGPRRVYPLETAAATWAGDLDSDGRDDLVIAFHGDDIGVQLSQPGGGFLVEDHLAGVSDPAGGASSFSFAGGDFDGDGDRDIAVSEWSGTVRILTNAGGGSFTAGQTVFRPGNYRTLAAADFNRDRILDLAVVDFSAGIRFFRGVGDGTFAAAGIISYSYPLDLLLGDFDRDGFPDVVVLANPAVSIYRNVGNGTFTTAGYFSNVGGGQYSIGDIDGDGKPDLIGADAYNAKLELLLGRGDGTFTRQPPTPIAGLCGATAGDFERNGRDELVIADTSGAHPVDRRADGTLAPRAPIQGSLCATLITADLDSDGRLDLLMTGSPLGFARGHGDGTFTRTRVYQHGDSPGDFDGDGTVDLLTAPGVSLLRNRGCE